MLSVWQRLSPYVARPWYVALVTVLAFLDLFVAFIPTEVFLVAAVMARPKWWLPSSVIVTTGSALGAMTLAGLVRGGGRPLLERYLPNLFVTEGWERVADFIHQYGDLALAGIALSPLPQQPAIVLAGLAQMPLLEIGLGVWLGRVIKYVVFAWLAAKAPAYIQKYLLLKQKLKHETFKAQK